MAITFSLERVRHYLIPAIASLIGLGVAVGIATVPSDVLNAAVDRGGFASILPAAASPIGATGRTLLALVAGALIASLGFVPQWKAMLVDRLDAFARRLRPGLRAGAEDDAPVIRRADAHPDAPPRRPIRAASDLGDPLPIFGEEDRRSAPLPPPVEQSLPDDLDRPLADFDPAAVPLRPMAPPEPVAPLMRAPEPPAPIEAPRPRFAWLAPDEEESEAVSPAVVVDETPVAVEPEEVSAPAPVVNPVAPIAPAIVHAAAVEASADPLATVPTELPTEPPVEPTPTPTQAATPPQWSRSVATPSAAEPVEDESIAGLLARLERGAAQRRIAPAPVAPPVTPDPAPEAEPVSLDETLQRLRRLAAG
jgi:hypothetical protein